MRADSQAVETIGGISDNRRGPIDASRFPCFDGLRAFAALTVIAVHTTFISGFTGTNGLGRYSSRLEIGVLVFFVISGFLLYRPFAFAHLSGTPSTPKRKFWTRRLKRIIPAYWVAFLVITYVLHADTVRHGWAALPIYLGFAQIYFPHYVLSGVGQAWSLCTEMTFYLMLPLWAALLARRKRGVRAQLRAELLGLTGLVVLGFAYRIPVLMAHGGMADVMPNWLPGYLDVFALGMLLAVVSAWLGVEGRQPRLLWHPFLPWVSWAAAGAAFVAVSNIGLPITPVTASPVGLSLARQTLYGLFAFFLVAPAVFGHQDRGAVRRSLQLRPIALIGVVSYGVYLWHEAWIMMMLRWTGDRTFRIPFPYLTVPVTALAIIAGTLSYRMVERPILRGRLAASPGRDAKRVGRSIGTLPADRGPTAAVSRVAANR